RPPSSSPPFPYTTLFRSFAALGIPFERRGARTREYIEVMRQLWTEKASSHAGEFVNFSGVLSYPKPVAAKGIPVWFGGESNAARSEEHTSELQSPDHLVC